MTTLTVALVRQALRACIETRWRPAAESDDGHLPLYAPGCQLCEVMADNGCYGCPVNEFTGHIGCQATPYQAWGLAGDRAERINHAKAEVDFLEMLDQHYFGEGSSERVEKMRNKWQTP